MQRSRLRFVFFKEVNNLFFLEFNVLSAGMDFIAPFVEYEDNCIGNIGFGDKVRRFSTFFLFK